MRALLISALVLLFGAGTAAAAGVSYVDGGQVWLASLDGSQKRSISGPAPAGESWTEAAQADNGTVIGVRRQPGKMGNLNATALWGPTGAPAGGGSLTAPAGWTTYAYPVTLDLTPDGGTVTYGYSNAKGFGLERTYGFGTYVEGSNAWYIDPFDAPQVEGATLAGSRLVGHEGGIVYYQDTTAGTPPYSNAFVPWLEAPEPRQVAASADGRVVAVALGPYEATRVAMIPFSGLGGAYPEDGTDCMLPTQGSASDVSISHDGNSIAWHDARGVLVAGTPVWYPSPTESTCNLSRPPVVISATGTMPSLGASTAYAPPPAPRGATKPKVSLAKKLKAAALRNGVLLTVTTAAAGKLTATGKVGKKTVAKGEVRAKRAGKVKLRLKATKAFKRKLGGLVGKSLKIKVSAPGGAVTLTRKLR